MRKYTGILSIIFLIIGASPFLLGIYFEFFAHNLFFIAAISYSVALILALIAEKGTAKSITLILLNTIAIGIIAFFVIMAFFWNQP